MGIIVKPARRKRKPIFFEWKRISGLLLVLLLSGWLYNRYVMFPPDEDQVVIRCDAENIKWANQKAVFYEDGFVFQNGHTQSNAFARSGKYASRIDSAHAYGMYYLLDNPQPHEQYYVSVWGRQSGSFHGMLVVQMTGDSESFRQEELATDSDGDEWARLEMVFTVPDTFKKGRITVYVMGWGSGEAYFDDMEIRKITPGNRMAFITSLKDSLPRLEIYLDRIASRQLERKQKAALESGILITEDDSWVNGKILSQEDKISIRLRLKGDWTDHLRTEKKSFRIQTKYPYTWQRMPVFSIQHPHARYFLAEWVYHKWLMYEGVLTSKYDFAQVEINGKAMGLYAYESHFTKELLESQQRREGPVLKFDESGVWQARLKAAGVNYGLEGQLNTFPAAPVQTFQDEQLYTDSLRMQQFRIGRQLMLQFKYGEKSADEVFDLEKMAKFYAIVDIAQAYHSLVWHNLRFYYNPISSRLEPIGFDGYSELGIMRYSSRPLIGANVKSDNEPFVNALHVNLFEDTDFAGKYLYYLETFSNETYLQEFLAWIHPQLRHRQKVIQREFSFYEYNPQILFDRAKDVRQYMYPLEHAGIQVYRQLGGKDTSKYLVNSHHILPLLVTGWGNTKGGGLTDSLSTPVLLEPFDKGKIARQYWISGPLQALYVYFRLPGLDSLYSAQVMDMPPHLNETPMQKLLKATILAPGRGYEIYGNQIIFPTGKLQSNQHILIPAGYEVYFEAGCELDLIEKAGFVSFSPVFVRGTSERPVLVRSSDHTGRGFSVLQAGKQSVINHAHFEGLNTWSYEGWQLTGAVTFYESDVHILHSMFGYSQCEDALNLIRSAFELESSLIHHASYDGLDVDFCTGNVNLTDCKFTGNDGMDFSGSYVRIINSKIEEAGDKGISVGEEAYVRVYSAEITGAKTAIASKDLSEVEIDDIKLRDCQTGFAAYQKKPEYGGGFIRVKSHTADKVNFLHWVAIGSTIEFPDKIVQAK